MVRQGREETVGKEGMGRPELAAVLRVKRAPLVRMVRLVLLGQRAVPVREPRSSLSPGLRCLLTRVSSR